MPKLTVDGQEVEVPPGASVLQACEVAGAEIPRFCYHERLSIAGNCRMCLVEIEKSPKPVASCAMPAGDGMVVHTKSEATEKARNGVMEFLLINHPLDCPICDQGGECDLQDQAMAYGFGRSTYREPKRAVGEKYMGPLIKTVMTRCIHCTRCVRFASEVGGVDSLGAVGRGETMEVTTYLEQALASELSGNVIDLCPVGALTSKPYAFAARSWELRKTESIDVTDALGSNIRIDTRGAEVLRVLPRTNDDINEEWISDKARFSCDGLRNRRLDQPWVRRDGRLQAASWTEAFDVITQRVAATSGDRMAAIAGDLVCAESLFALKGLMTAVGSPHLDCRQDGAALPPQARAGWLFNTTIAGIDQADACLLIGTSPRHEAAVLNARLRKRWLAGNFPIGAIGDIPPQTYPVENLDSDTAVLNALATGSHPFGQILEQASKPMLILGQGALARPDGSTILHLARQVAERYGLVLGADGETPGWNGFNVLHLAAGRVGGMELGFVPGAGGRDVAGILDGAATGVIDIVFNLGADEIPGARFGQAFVIYLGHHGDAGADRADVILPGAAYTEKDAIWVNTEGRAQHAYQAHFPPGEAREDWTIVRALSEHLGHPLPFDTLIALRDAMAAASPVFAATGQVVPAAWTAFDLAEGAALDATPLTSPVSNFYRTDVIGRASATMTDCTAVFIESAPTATGTEG